MMQVKGMHLVCQLVGLKQKEQRKRWQDMVAWVVQKHYTFGTCKHQTRPAPHVQGCTTFSKGTRHQGHGQIQWKWGKIKHGRVTCGFNSPSTLMKFYATQK